MQSKSDSEPFRRTRRVLGFALALVIVACGWAYGVLYVEGGSMEPALSAGDVIVYRRAGAAPGVGDLVVFEHGGVPVVHRVAGVLRDGTLRTRGDANASLDGGAVEPSAVMGEVVLTLPTGRLVSRLVASAR